MLKKLSLFDATLSVVSDRAKRTGETDTPAVKAILSAIEADVNTGKNFAPLRQMYHAVILSNYFKKSTSDGTLVSYADSSDLTRRTKTPADRADKVFGLYKTAFEKGAYDLTKENRRYVSGGITVDTQVRVSASSITSLKDAAFLRVKLSLKSLRGVVGAGLGVLALAGSADAALSDYTAWPDTINSIQQTAWNTLKTSSDSASRNNAYQVLIDNPTKQLTDSVGGQLLKEPNTTNNWALYAQAVSAGRVTLSPRQIAYLLERIDAEKNASADVERWHSLSYLALFAKDMLTQKFFFDRMVAIEKALWFIDPANESDQQVRYYALGVLRYAGFSTDASVLARMKVLEPSDPANANAYTLAYTAIKARAPVTLLHNELPKTDGLSPTQLHDTLMLAAKNTPAAGEIGYTKEIEALAIKNFAISDVFTPEQDQKAYDLLVSKGTALKKTTATAATATDPVTAAIDYAKPIIYARLHPTSVQNAVRAAMAPKITGAMLIPGQYGVVLSEPSMVKVFTLTGKLVWQGRADKVFSWETMRSANVSKAEYILKIEPIKKANSSSSLGQVDQEASAEFREKTTVHIDTRDAKKIADAAPVSLPAEAISLLAAEIDPSEVGGIDLTMGAKVSKNRVAKQGDNVLEFKIKSIQRTTLHKYLKSVGVN